jgi:hypothetical protein
LMLANTTQVYPDDRGTNYAVREAEEVVRLLLGSEPVTRFGAPVSTAQLSLAGPPPQPRPGVPS